MLKSITKTIETVIIILNNEEKRITISTLIIYSNNKKIKVNFNNLNKRVNKF
jgi:hypothetical protein